MSDELTGAQWRELDALCNQFDDALAQGAAPVLRAYWQQGTPAIQERLFAELLRAELEQHHAQQRPMEWANYARAWPQYRHVLTAVFAELGLPVEPQGASPMRCLQCGTDNPPDRTTCLACQQPLPAPATTHRPCPKCDKPMPRKATFCGYCGNKMDTPAPSVAPQPSPVVTPPVTTPPPVVSVPLPRPPAPVTPPPVTPTPTPAAPAPPVVEVLPKRPIVLTTPIEVVLGGQTPKGQRAPLDIEGPLGALRPMVLIPEGPFLMGSPAGIGRDDERPQHQVQLSAYYIDRAVVTNAEYEQFAPKHRRARPDESSGDDDPAVLVTYQECLNYCLWRAAQEGVPSSTYLLPTEAQWERAARGGFAGRLYPWGETLQTTFCNCAEAGLGRALAAASGTPNGFQLFNMGSNVREWCFDAYELSFYKSAGAGDADTAGPPLNLLENLRVIRGTSFAESGVVLARCAARAFANPQTMQNDLGFRCVRLVRRG